MINENVAFEEYQPAIPSYWVGTAVAAAGVVIVLVISTLYYFLVHSKGERSEEDAREVLREAVRHHNMEYHLDMESLEMQSYVNPKPTPSIFREGEFLMEVLEGIDNIHIGDGNSDERDLSSVTIKFEEIAKDLDLDVSAQLELTLSIRSLSHSKPSLNPRGIVHDLEMSGRVDDGCVECDCPCPATVLSEQYPPTVADVPDIQVQQGQGLYLSERGERRVDLHPESTMLEVKAIFDTVLSELTEKGDYTKFDDSTIDEIHMIENRNFESSTPVLNSNSSSPSDIIQIPRSSRTCACNDHDEAPSVPVTLSSSANLSNSTSIPKDTATLLVSQSREVETPMFHLSLDASATHLSGTSSSETETTSVL